MTVMARPVPWIVCALGHWILKSKKESEMKTTTNFKAAIILSVMASIMVACSSNKKPIATDTATEVAG
ncbi:hypothetical protein [Muricauda sp. MAR_2010_75]|uniref:hypothetical protein n=1 Tax=Allomuricauda sp. MAR_2010_75 TaxID=1250232 RepID=UPI00056D32E0|nr:hypothetical protein [Muricauda sp. MAR_2010_75]